MQAESEKGLASPSPFLLAAQRLVACGVNVIPISRENKIPAIRWERFQTERLLGEVTDKIDVYLSSWWGRSDPYNLAVVTGEVSGVAVVDVDSLAARQLVTDTIGCWPRTVNSDKARHPAVTPTATTPKDGWHLWYRYEPGMRNVVRRGGEKLDARGDGGYVLVPPSFFGRGDYRWGVSPFVSEGGVWPPMPMPDELHALLWPTRKVTPTGVVPTILTDKYVAAVLEREVANVRAALVGTRNDTLNRAVFAVWRFVTEGRLDAEVVVREFAYAARACGLEDGEATATIQSAIAGRHG